MGLSSYTISSTKETPDLGKFSISLAVADIEKSFAFYQKLGFEKLEGAGSLESKWIIMVNGNSKIGLFQEMFPSNTITFNPKNGRKIKAHLQAEGISTNFESGFDKTEGPCTMALTDPDGNPILIDQH